VVSVDKKETLASKMEEAITEAKTDTNWSTEKHLVLVSSLYWVVKVSEVVITLQHVKGLVDEYLAKFVEAP
jgi:hypothetical protein